MIKFNHIATIRGGQDGAIWGDFLFRFGSEGECAVYDLRGLSRENAQPVAAFTLDKANKLVPHSNTVFFGTEYARPGDEFPLLYSNIYYNYAKYPDRLEGICCVYRLWREDDGFKTKLVQLVEVGFADDRDLWRSESVSDVRPYGNFIIDRQRGLYYAFTMRDEAAATRYFAFRLPRLDAGERDPVYGVNRVVLREEDILTQFDCPYHHYVQGACCHDGKIYSLEGFTNSEENPPALRIIDTDRECQETLVMMGDFGLTIEPELIDFAGDTCWYCDNSGNLYVLKF